MARRLRGWGRADDDTDSLPVLAPDQVDEQASHDATGHGVPGAPDEEAAPVDHEATSTVTPATEREVPAWVKRFGDAVVARLTRLSAVILGGMALCLSFPPFGPNPFVIPSAARNLLFQHGRKTKADSSSLRFSE